MMGEPAAAADPAAPMAEAAGGKWGSAGGSTTAATLRAMLGSAAAGVPKPFGGAAQRAVEERTRGFVSGVAAKVAAGPQATDAKHPLSDAMRQNPLLALLAPAADASYATKQAFARAVQTDALDKVRAFVAGSEVVGEYSRDALANYVATVKALSAAARTALSGKAGVLNLTASDLKNSVVSLKDAAGAASAAGNEELQRKAADAVVAADALGEAAVEPGRRRRRHGRGRLRLRRRQGRGRRRRLPRGRGQRRRHAQGHRREEGRPHLRRRWTRPRPPCACSRWARARSSTRSSTCTPRASRRLRAGLRMAVAAIEAAPVPSDLVVVGHARGRLARQASARQGAQARARGRERRRQGRRRAGRRARSRPPAPTRPSRSTPRSTARSSASPPASASLRARSRTSRTSSATTAGGGRRRRRRGGGRRARARRRGARVEAAPVVDFAAVLAPEEPLNKISPSEKSKRERPALRFLPLPPFFPLSFPPCFCPKDLREKRDELFVDEHIYSPPLENKIARKERDHLTIPFHKRNKNQTPTRLSAPRTPRKPPSPPPGRRQSDVPAPSRYRLSGATSRASPWLAAARTRPSAPRARRDGGGHGHGQRRKQPRRARRRAAPRRRSRPRRRAGSRTPRSVPRRTSGRHLAHGAVARGLVKVRAEEDDGGAGAHDGRRATTRRPGTAATAASAAAAADDDAPAPAAARCSRCCHAAAAPRLLERPLGASVR